MYAFVSLWPVDGIFVLLGVITWLYRDTASAGRRAFAVAGPAAWNSQVMICAIRRLALTVSDVCLRLICSHTTSTYSALEVSHFMRYTNLRLTYLHGLGLASWKKRVTKIMHIFIENWGKKD